MDGDKLILIVEDEAWTALDLTVAVERAGGTVLGPSASVTEALDLLGQHRVSAAILDANLLDGDVTPVALYLLDRAVPVVLHSAVGPPPGLVPRISELTVVGKPGSAAAVVARLEALLAG